MNDVGAAGGAVEGGWFRPDPAHGQDSGCGGPLEVEPSEGRELAGRPADGRPRDVRE